MHDAESEKDRETTPLPVCVVQSTEEEEQSQWCQCRRKKVGKPLSGHVDHHGQGGHQKGGKEGETWLAQLSSNQPRAEEEQQQPRAI